MAGISGMPGRLLINYVGKDGGKSHDREFNSAMQGDADQQVAVRAWVRSGENLRSERISCAIRTKANNLIADISTVGNFISISKPLLFSRPVYAKKHKAIVNTFYYLHSLN